MMRFLLPAALAFALMAGSAEATDFSVIGVGLWSCGSWTAARRDRTRQGPEQRVVGFLSGIGYEGVDEREITFWPKWTPMAFRAWVDNYCRAHPLDPIVTVGQAFDRDHPRRPPSG